METVRLPPSPHYLPPYPPPPPYLPDLHPALLQRYVTAAAAAAGYCSEPLAPLDLSVKPTPITPPCTPPPDLEPVKPKIFRHFEEDCDRKRPSEDPDDNPEVKKLKFTRQFFDELRSCLPERAGTPERSSPEVREVEQRPKKAAPKPTVGTAAAATVTKKSKAVRRLQFDEDNTSPVSGTIIRDLGEDETLVVRKGDIDPAFNVVEITEEAKALIAGIDNRIGRYICRLCRRLYPDAFALAQHRCERIVHIEYRCPECDKVFNCPANLASHRRWHKPRPPAGSAGGGKPAARRPPAPAGTDLAPLDSAEGTKFSCKVCGKTFRRQAYLRKHYQAHEAAGKSSVDGDGDVDASPDDAATAAKPERSAFRQVRAAPYALAERLRGDDYNAFWGKLPRSEFGFDAYYDRPLETEAPRLDYVSSNVSSHSEDSRSLDITGSEDEGSRGRWDGGGGGG